MGRVCAKSFEIEVIVIVKLNGVGLKAVTASCSFEILSHFAQIISYLEEKEFNALYFIAVKEE